MIVYTNFNLDKEIFHVSETLNIIFTHNFCNNDSKNIDKLLRS